MKLSLRESRAVADLAEHLYEFLPGSGSRNWKGHVSFKTAAEKVGVAEFWQPGSKLPMLVALLQRTLEQKRGCFEKLILEVVRGSLTYRQKENNPLRTVDIEKLNGHLLDLGYRFPDLWDAEFLSSLNLTSSTRAAKRVDEAKERAEVKIADEAAKSTEARAIRDEFFSLHAEPSRQKAGFLLERVLNRLFALHGLSPREPFRVVGEQIDGSFDLDHETYLVEAKWEKEALSEAPLLVFRGKIEGKSAFTRGVFISLGGISEPAKQAIVVGKRATFFVIDGYDLTMVLSEQIGLPDFLRRRRRILAEEGGVVVPFGRLGSVSQ